MNYLNMIAFGIFPYIAIIVCFVATWVRYDREQYTWKASSSQLLESKMLKRGSIPFHVGIIFVLMGHFVGLLTPVEVWHFLGVHAEVKQLIAMGMGGFFGLICLYGMVILIVRRLTNPRVRATSSTMDIVVLLMLFVQLLLGMSSIFVSANHLDGAEMMMLMSWAQNFVTFDAIAAAQAIEPVHWIYKLHVFFGMTLFIAFPFSRLVHIASVPVKYFGRNYQVVRKKAWK
jgi:nitrate reductase gamma subunit